MYFKVGDRVYKWSNFSDPKDIGIVIERIKNKEAVTEADKFLNRVEFERNGKAESEFYFDYQLKRAG